jgi:hypothetical protein
MPVETPLHTRRWFLIGSGLAAIAAAATWIRLRGRPAHQQMETSMFDRVVFVCVNNSGDYSPGVYLQGTGGEDGMQIIPQAAPYMRTPEAGDAAAGLCGYLFKQIGDDAARGGGLSLYDSPKPRPDGTVDWQTYCGVNVDLVLVQVEKGTAELFSGSADLKSPDKTLLRTISGLHFGG